MFQEYVPKEYDDLHSSSRLVVKVSALQRKVKGSLLWFSKDKASKLHALSIPLFTESYLSAVQYTQICTDIDTYTRICTDIDIDTKCQKHNLHRRASLYED